MKVKNLMAALQGFDPEAEVRLCMNWPGRIAEVLRQFWVGDYGGGPQINATVDFRGVSVYVGCVLEQPVRKGVRVQSPTDLVAEPSGPAAAHNAPGPAIVLGNYESSEIAAHVRDFYVYHHGLDEPLNFPDFDYERWIPPKTTAGDYNEHIAAILREKSCANDKPK